MSDEDIFLDSMEDLDSGDEQITVYYTAIVTETKKAYLFRLSPGNIQLWMPKSMIDLHSSNGHLPTQKKFTVRESFFEKCFKAAKAKTKAANEYKAVQSFDAIDEDE